MRVKVALAAALVAIVTLAPAGAAMADGGEEDFTAKDFVEQAIGLLQAQPDMGDLIQDRIGDALEDDEVEGVDMALVEQAQTAFQAGSKGEALQLLGQSIGKKVGPELHAPEVGGGFAAPSGVAGPALVAVAAALILAGAFVAVKVR